MAAQDVRELIPRVRRAIEGPRPLSGADALTDGQVEALAADCIADIILMTAGQWQHSLVALEMSTSTPAYPTHWSVDPGLSFEEQSVIAAQAALAWNMQEFSGSTKVSERIKNEGREWEWQKSAQLLVAHLKTLKEQRDAALAALIRKNPVLTRYASFLQTRDAVMATMLEPWATGGLGGGMLLCP
jgi:hypothetical protein